MRQQKPGGNLFQSLWRALDANAGTSLRAHFQIENHWQDENRAWMLHGRQEFALGGASVEFVILGAQTAMFRLPGDSRGRECPWVLASYKELDWKHAQHATLACTAKCSDGEWVSFRVYVFAGSGELEIVEIDPRERPRLLKLFSGIQWSQR